MKEIQFDNPDKEYLSDENRYENDAAELSELIRCDMLRYPRKLDSGDDVYE